MPVPLQTWRGPRFTAEVYETAAPGAGADWESRPSGPRDASELAALFAPGPAAAWMAPPEHGLQGGRLAVVVREHLAHEHLASEHRVR